jgi:hypothetical protein
MTIEPRLERQLVTKKKVQMRHPYEGIQFFKNKQCPCTNYCRKKGGLVGN